MHVVVVDPSRVVLRIVTDLLEARGDRVTALTNSSEAVEVLAADRSVEVLITSVEVQPITGIELCWWARLLAASSRPVYILAMSSLHSDRSVAEALDSGADDLINKPISRDELYARLRSAARVLSMQRELIRLAETDPLSGLLNRRAFFARMSESVDQAATGQSLSVMIFDIDHFKRVNDNHGHDVGDAVIRAVAKEASAIDGFVGRLGGEEFTIAMPRRSVLEAAEIAEDLRRKIEALRVPTATGEIAFTCSFGINAWSAGDTVDQLMKSADIALYNAKSAGRNRVVVAGSAVAASTELDGYRPIVRTRPRDPEAAAV